MSGRQAPRLSLVVPIHNEAENIAPLLEEIAEVLAPLSPFEVLLVDDCSTDDSLLRANTWRDEYHADWLRVVQMAERSGQSGAVMAGADEATSELVAMMDGDLQNDPRDLLPMVEMVSSGEWDGVQGNRTRRRDNLVRRVSSRIGNGVRNVITGDVVRDSACGIKVFRRELLMKIPRFSGVHRFMPTLVRYAGGRVQEIPVRHRPRTAGQAKYGVGNRALRGLRDCLRVRRYRGQLSAE